MPSTRPISLLCVAISMFCAGVAFAALPAPTLVQPADGTTLTDISTALGNEVSLEWALVAGATGYRWQVSRDSRFANIAYQQDVGATEVEGAFSPSAGVNYWWRVQALGGTTANPWSPIWRFTYVPTLTIPVLQSPANNAVDVALDANLAWAPLAMLVTGFDVQIGTDAALATPVINTTTPNYPGPNDGVVNFALAGLTKATAYFWRVRPFLGTVRGPWSETWQFTTRADLTGTAPTLVSPANGATAVDLPAALSFDPVAGATRYALQVATDAAFLNMVQGGTITPSGAGPVTTSAILPSGTTVYWRVRCLDATDKPLGPWSTVWSLKTKGTTHAAPTPTSPANGATNLPGRQPVKLTWSAVTGASGYEVRYSRGQSFAATDTFVVGDATGTTYTVAEVTPNSPVYWCVRAVFGNETGSWSAPRTFQTTVGPVTGSDRWLFVLARFSDSPTVTPGTLAEFQDKIKEVDNFWRETSYGAYNIAGSTVVDWVNLPGTMASYINAEGKVDVEKLVTDAALLAGPTINLSDYYGIGCITNVEFTGPSRGGAPRAMTIGTVTDDWACLALDGPAEMWGVYGHEMGHGLGLDHVWTYTEYDTEWDIMGQNTTSFCAPVKAALGWMPAARKRVISAFGQQQITVERLAQPANTSGVYAIEIPIPGMPGSSYMVEARKPVGFDAAIPHSAVVIHLTGNSGAYAGTLARVMEDVPDGNPNDEGGMWMIGETFADPAHGISVTIVSESATAFVVRVNTGPVAPPTLAQPVLMTPLDRQLVPATGAALSWTGVPNATGYRAQVSLTNTFAVTTVNEVVAGAATQLTPTTLQPGKVYYWRVQAINVGPPAANGPWSPVFTFTTETAPVVIDQPALLAPVDGTATAVTATVFRWSPVAGATSYQVQASADATFTTVDVDRVIPGGATVTPTINLQTGTTYTWRVAAIVGAPATTGPWSDPFTVTILGASTLSAPTLIAPAPNVIDVPVATTLSWQPPATATSQRVQVSTLPDYATTIVNEVSTVTVTTRDVALQPGTTYYWRVAGIIDGPPFEVGPWSLSSTFTTVGTGPATDTVTLLAPADGATNQPQKPWFSWATLNNPEFVDYHFQVATDRNFTNVIRNHPKVLVEEATMQRHGRPIGPTWQVVAPLTKGQTYYWRVRGILTTGPAPWSTVWAMTVTTLDTPNPRLPIDGNPRAANPATLTWSTVTGATSYSVQVSTDPFFAGPMVADLTTTAPSAPDVALDPSTAYYWRVSATGATGTSPWSEVSAFTTTSLTQPVLLTPANSAVDVAAPATLTWDPVLGAVSYTLEAARDSAFTQLRLRTNVTGTSHTLNTLDTGSYYWRVRAINATDTGGWSRVFSFSTGRIASQPDLLVRLVAGGAYYGWCFYHSANGQSLMAPAVGGQPVVFNLAVRNTGLQTEGFDVTTGAVPAGWQMTAKDSRGQDISAELTAGWRINLGVGELRDFTITMTPAGAQPYAPATLPVKVVATRNIEMYDNTTVTATYQP